METRSMRWWLNFALMLSIQVSADIWSDLNLPEEHIPFYFNSHPSVRKQCEVESNCPYKELLSKKKCWGLEESCPKDQRMLTPQCPQDSPHGWAKDKAAQIESFWMEADFGYMKQRLTEMTTLCQPEQPDDSLLKCSKYMRYCRATNIYMDFSETDFYNSKDRYRQDIFGPGQVGGKCRLDKVKLKAEHEHKSPLQSWYAEFEHYTSLDFHPIQDKKCDIIIDKPTILMKLDSGVNMYHHFCDYVNLYASQHMNRSFTQDVNIVMWDTSGFKYGDFFDVTWKAFTDHPIIPLKDYEGKKVCFRDALFPLLPRMRYGLYYNMPLIPGCTGSSFFRAFCQHVLHRLGIRQKGPLKKKFRITFLVRTSKYRKIMNQGELVNALNTVGEYEVKVVNYNREIPFEQQLAITHNSDLFMGIHGAGLTHMLFQPDWGTGFEIYNCEDAGCYSDLARLRGVNYITWENKEKLIQEDEGHHPTLGAHAKFTNYAFDVVEFMRVVAKGVDYIRHHPAYKKAWEEKWGEPVPEAPSQERVEL